MRRPEVARVRRARVEVCEGREGLGRMREETVDACERREGWVV